MKNSLLLLTLVMVSGSSSADDELFNKKDLRGWRVEGKKADGHWKVEGDRIVGENADKTGSVLWTKSDFQDFDLTLDYKTTSKDYDTGVFARATSHQIQIGISRSLKKDMTGCIYAPKDKQGSYPGQTDKVAKFHKLGDWNTLRIVVKGKSIQTFLNGEEFVDYEAKTIPANGPIGLQLHGGVHMKVEFKNLKLKELK